MMDDALDSPDEEFASKLKEVKKITVNLIDSYTQPLLGLVKYSAKSPDAAREVKEMFNELLRTGTGDVADKQARVDRFLSRSLDIRQREWPDSYLYKDDMHSVTGYLFLYDPEHNHFFKASHAKDFADCIEFYDDWGSGVNVKLAIYYRMCDWVVEQIKESDELLKTNEYRYQNLWNNPADGMHPDVEKHILAFDIIYCCSNYGLFHGITFSKPKLKERQLILERRNKASELAAILEKAKAENEVLEEAMEYVNSVLVPGLKVKSRRNGDGVIKENKGDGRLLIDFSIAGEKLLGTAVSLANDIITVEDEEFSKWLNENKAVLKDEKKIPQRLETAANQFAPYAEYLE